LKERERDDRDDEIARLKSKVEGETMVPIQRRTAMLDAIEARGPLSGQISRNEIASPLS
jgi:hypothetical protein